MRSICLFLLIIFTIAGCREKKETEESIYREVVDFNFDWQFSLGDHPEASQTEFADSTWRSLNLPHDWSIEGEFSEKHETEPQGGALPAGIGWYRKTFTLPQEWENRSIWIEFDGIYRNSEVWINGEYLGKRPYGYSSFSYTLSEHLNFGETAENIIAVKVDNSAQPNSRWYTGSGIYRNVRLVATGKTHVSHWGTHWTTPEVDKDEAKIVFEVDVQNDDSKESQGEVITSLINARGLELASDRQEFLLAPNSKQGFTQNMILLNPKLWSVETPNLYRLETKVYQGEHLVDELVTTIGFRSFNFDDSTGFSLNGQPMKIHGVCLHHDLGALGAAFNIHAAKRQLMMMKEMGANAIRTAHNPPAPEVLALCDTLGLLVQDESFDVWQKGKVKQDYQTNFEEWHEEDLIAMLKRDRNHPSVFMWNIGNEIPNQFDSLGSVLATKLTTIVKEYDKSRPVTSALTENNPEKNYISQSGALDVLSFNYKHQAYDSLPERFPDIPIMASENVSALMTRGVYDFPADSLKAWPVAYNEPFDGHDDYTASAFDHTYAYWGSTHEQTWKTVKSLNFMAGLFIWTGWDYLGEPTPYDYPARSSYFGIVDLAGFPKDIYYMYQSEWSDKNVLHLFPHWNWEEGKVIDVWAYYNNADEVELFLNDQSLGTRKKEGDDLHVSWKIPYVPGTLKAVSRKEGNVVLEKEVKTAGEANKIQLSADKNSIHSDHYDMVFVTVDILDENNVLVPRADNLVNFEISGGGTIVGVDNGYQASLEPFKANYRKAFNGKCLVMIQSNGEKENIELIATSEGLEEARIKVGVK